MLPLLRILPVGGVFFAIMIVLLALNPPGGTDSTMPSSATPARGALVRAGEHPEWRQFLIQAAVRRAEELERLRELPDTPIRIPEVEVETPPLAVAEEPPKTASLPAERIDADPDDQTGSISDMPSATIPIEIGETSSTELPVTAPPETPSIIKTPERSRSLNDSRPKPRAVRRPNPPAKPAVAAPPSPNFFEAIFGTPPKQPPAPATTPARKTSTPAPARPATVSAEQR